jgi:hypothetical protein
VNDAPSPEALVPLRADPAVRRVERRLAGLALLTAAAIGLAVLNHLVAPARENGPEARVPVAPLPDLLAPAEEAPGGDLLEALKRPQSPLPGVAP